MMHGFWILAKVTCPAASSPFLSCSWNRQPSSLWIAFAMAVCCQQLSFSGNGLVLDSCLPTDTWVCWHPDLSSGDRATACPWQLRANTASVLCGQRRCQGARPSVPGQPSGFMRTLSHPRKHPSTGFLFAMMCFCVPAPVTCSELNCVHSLFAGSVPETVISALGEDPERQEREAGKT